MKATSSGGYSSGISSKYFTVLLHVDGEKKILRDVALSDTHDVLELVSLHAQLRAGYLLGTPLGGSKGRVPVVEYFDDARQAFLEVTDRSWASMSSKRHIELRLVDQSYGGPQVGDGCGSERPQHKPRLGDDTSNSNRATGGPTKSATGEQTSASNASGASTAAPSRRSVPQSGGVGGRVSVVSRRAHVVDAIRKLLAMEYPLLLKPRGSATAGPAATKKDADEAAKTFLVRLCSTVLHEYQTKHGLSETAMNEEVADPTLVKAIAAQVGPIVHREVRRQRGNTSPPPPTNQDRKGATSPASTPSIPPGSRGAPRPPAVLVTAGREDRDPNPPPNTHVEGRSFAELRGGSSPSNAAPSLLLVRGGRDGGAEVGPPEVADDSNGFYKSSSASHSARISQFAAPATGAPPPFSTTFRTVKYSICGPFPPPPFDTDGAQAPTIRVSLSAPSTSVVLPDEDILITAHVIARSVTSLTWWLGYGPQRVTLNLDEMYRRRAVTTFQVSETGLLLTIRRGTLVPGWQYHVYLSATSDITGVSAADEASFALQKSTAAPPCDASGSTPAARYLPLSVRGSTSVHQHHLKGYEGDEDYYEDLTRRTAAGSASPPSNSAQRLPSGYGNAATDHHNSASELPLDGTGQLLASPLKRRDATVVPPTIATTHPIGMTFQEQLKQFFMDEVQPLYRLCSRPNIRQDAFQQMIQGIAQTYWYCRPAEANLDVGLQREIVERVKEAVVAQRNLHRRAAATNGFNGHTARSDGSSIGAWGEAAVAHIPPAGLRPQYQSVIRR